MGHIDVSEFLEFVFLQSISVTAWETTGKRATKAAVAMNFFI